MPPKHDVWMYGASEQHESLANRCLSYHPPRMTAHCAWQMAAFAGLCATLMPASGMTNEMRKGQGNVSGEAEGSASEKQAMSGVKAGICCYLFWGLAPIYWKLLGHVSSMEVIGHRVLWSFVFMAVLCLALKNGFPKILRDKRAWAYLAPAGLLIMLNWSLYIYAVDTDRVVHPALGYYINPLVSILLGVAFFREKLTALQKAAVGLCAAGVLYFLYDFGELP